MVILVEFIRNHTSTQLCLGQRAETESNIEGSVARRMELLEKGQLETPPEPAPPTFIELPASATSGVSPSTNYVNM
jgi:hypothetical protein